MTQFWPIDCREVSWGLLGEASFLFRRRERLTFMVMFKGSIGLSVDAGAAAAIFATLQ